MDPLQNLVNQPEKALWLLGTLIVICLTVIIVIAYRSRHSLLELSEHLAERLHSFGRTDEVKAVDSYHQVVNSLDLLDMARRGVPTEEAGPSVAKAMNHVLDNAPAYKELAYAYFSTLSDDAISYVAVHLALNSPVTAETYAAFLKEERQDALADRFDSTGHVARRRRLLPRR